MSGGRKLEPPFGLDMNFGEALERFIRTKPEEVAESIERSKQKRPPEDKSSKRPLPSRRKRPSDSG